MSLAEILDIPTIVAGLSPTAKVFPPGSPGYNTSTTSYYWLNSEESPKVVIQPAIPEDVQWILQNVILLHHDPRVTFAVKAGGHIAVPGFSSSNGVLIDMALFNQIEYNKTTSFVDVGPGQIWDNVSTKLVNNYNVNVNGATTCKNVGVGGFLLGGGYGNKTNQFGLAIDNIQAMNVVQPNGEIVTANAESYADLFQALKGGGNNFGIVTNWTLRTHPQIGDIYSHVLNIESQYFPQLITAIVDFSKLEVPKSNVEAIFEYTRDPDTGIESIGASVELYYDDPSPPAGLFDEFLAIPTSWQRLDRTWQDRQDNLPGNHQTYRFGRPNGVNDIPTTFRGRFSSVMVSHYTAPLIEAAIGAASSFMDKFAHHKGFQIYVDIWPFVSTIFDNSPPSAWPHTKGNPSGPLVINLKWEGQENDNFWLPAMETMTADLVKIAVEQGCSTYDAAQYYNLSLDNVTPSDIYRGNFTQLQAVRQKYDKDNVMGRTGGFRIPLP